jgi:hypothetical protein
MLRSVHRLARADVLHARTIVVQTGESSDLMRRKRRLDLSFPQSFPQFL